MARIRSLKIGFFNNEQLCEFSPWHRLLFAGLWVLADREGRLEDRPKRIKAELFPYDDLDVDTLLTELAEKGFVVRYGASESGARYLAIPHFIKHQRPNVREAVSVIPAPCCTESTTLHVQGQGEWDLGNGILGMGNRKGGSTTTSVEPASPAALTFPTQGPVAIWCLTEAQIAKWRGLFPALDVLGECRKAWAWCDANPTRRKTAAGMSRFLVRWLSRAVDDGRVPAVTPRTTASTIGRRELVPTDEPL